MKAKGGA